MKESICSLTDNIFIWFYFALFDLNSNISLLYIFFLSFLYALLLFIALIFFCLLILSCVLKVLNYVKPSALWHKRRLINKLQVCWGTDWETKVCVNVQTDLLQSSPPKWNRNRKRERGASALLQSQKTNAFSLAHLCCLRTTILPLQLPLVQPSTLSLDWCVWPYHHPLAIKAVIDPCW